MGLSCWESKIYDWAKQRRAVRWLFYSGKGYHHFGPITLAGTVTDCPKKATDGDACFDIAIPGLPPRHCEATPCYPGAQSIARTLRPGDLVRVWGTDTWDDDHHFLTHEFHGGGNEVHPCTAILVLRRAPQDSGVSKH